MRTKVTIVSLRVFLFQPEGVKLRALIQGSWNSSVWTHDSFLSSGSLSHEIVAYGPKIFASINRTKRSSWNNLSFCCQVI